MPERFAVVPYEGKQDYIFISYSHKDTNLVYPILQRLSQNGYRLWYDEGIDPGSEWPESIAEHLGNAAACIAMISNNYLASDNCRREMNFALKRQKPMLSVLLEDAEMSAGVEMQLSANQAIFKHLLPSEEIFMEKIHGTKILQSSRGIIRKEPVKAPEAAPVRPVQAPPARQFASTQPVAPAPQFAPVQAPASAKPVAPAQQVAPAQPVAPTQPVAPVRQFTPAQPVAPAKQAAPVPETRKAQQETPPKEKEKKRLGKKQWTYLLIGAAALVVALVVILVVVGSSSGSNSDSTSVKDVETLPASSEETFLSAQVDATDSQTVTDIIAVPNVPLNKETLLTSSAYAGRVLWGRKAAEDYADKDAFVQRAKFADIALEGGVKNVSVLPYEIEVLRDDHPEIVRLYFYDMIGTEFIVQGAYAISDGMLTISPCEAVFEDALPLAEKLEYQISLGSNSLSLQTTAETGSRSLSYSSAVATLSGAADNAAYKDVLGLEAQTPAEGVECTVLFTDGGHANDATVKYYYPSIGSITAHWTQENRLYNDVMSDFDVDGRCSFDYLNTYPNGFILFDYKNVYFYQQPLPEDTPGND